VIEQRAIGHPGDGVALCLRPNRSISARGLARFFALLATTSIAVAVYSASQGNVFAPPFAVLELSVLALCLRLVWVGLGCQETIALSSAGVSVVHRPAWPQDPVGFHPCWVRLERQPGRTGTARERLMLTSHGRALEIGAFLGDEEREALEQRLRQALAQCREARG
jgi:uncharacterized membrane protein